MSAPASTYRVQVNAAFTLSDAARVAAYLGHLGIGALYSSPVLASAEGSTHGYDVVAYDHIDDEAGGREGLDALAEALRANGLGLVLDIVPNHTAITAGNAWWWDVLKHGQDSRYAKAFDIEWSRHDGRVLLPFLAEPLAEALANGAIVRDGETLRYADHVWPIAAGTGDGNVAEVVRRQHYLPAYWREGTYALNYRRFFDVATLAGLRVEDPDVFAEVHALVVDLVREGVVTGLRVDHVDGLADPRGYLDRLAAATGGVWTVVEKILVPGERLQDGWACAGTTGYDALAEVCAQFVDPDGLAALTRVYEAFTGDAVTWEQIVAQSKRLVLTQLLGSEVEWLHRMAPHQPRDEIVESLVSMPVYRTYEPPGGQHPAYTARFQQISGPVMAKGVEDTAFYRYTRLVSLNEVGGSPERTDLTIDPDRRGMTTLSTHDTKRSEDVRARISLLTEIPDEWAAAVARWSAITRHHGDIERNLEYLLYQTFVGAYPLPVDRAVAYALKAAREQKQRTSWLDPDPGYEATVERWVRHTLCDATFLADLDGFMAPLVVHGWVASLAQKLVQLTMPGVPDVYQGTELWDFSLVDPDNRTPVDYGLRRRLLAEVDSLGVEDIGDRAAEGLPKLLVVSRALRLRRARPEAFVGTYEPLAAEGAWAERVLAFARGGTVVTVVPRRFVEVEDWKDTTLSLPEGRWRNVLTGEAHHGGDLLVADLLGKFPVALLERR